MRKRGYHNDDHEPPPSGYCPGCGEFITAVWQDCGIGPYEFWGARGFHSAWCLVCPKCDEQVSEDSLGTIICHVCRHYDGEDMDCNLALDAINLPGPDKIDIGDTCRFFEVKDEGENP